MKKGLLTIFSIVFFSISAYAQIDSVQVEKRLDQLELQSLQMQGKYDSLVLDLKSLNNAESALQLRVSRLIGVTRNLRNQLDSVNNLVIEKGVLIASLNQQLAEQRQELSTQISETREAISKSVSELDDAVSNSTLYWVIAILTLAIVSITSLVAIQRKVKNNQLNMSENLANTRKALEQEAIRLDEKLVEILETQLKILREEGKAQSINPNQNPDHSLSLKVADNIISIEKNISRMDQGTKGLKQLIKAIDRIRDNFASNGYEIVDMLNKPYEEGLKALVTFRPDPDLVDGKPRITRLIKPQVNYKGIMIQQAQIEVSQPE